VTPCSLFLRNVGTNLPKYRRTSRILKMEAVRSSETTANVCQTTLHHILYLRRENLLSHINWESPLKVKLPLYHKDIRGSGGIAPPSMNSALDGDEWSSSGTGRFTIGNHSTGGWLGPKATSPTIINIVYQCFWEEFPEKMSFGISNLKAYNKHSWECIMNKSGFTKVSTNCISPASGNLKRLNT
jgi:hypothetical protein